MCLLKIYLDDGSNRRLIAEDIALIINEASSFKLLDLKLRNVTLLRDVDVSSVDTLNSIMIFKPKKSRG